jgi:hypothetical protein
MQESNLKRSWEFLKFLGARTLPAWVLVGLLEDHHGSLKQRIHPTVKIKAPHWTGRKGRESLDLERGGRDCVKVSRAAFGCLH